MSKHHARNDDPERISRLKKKHAELAERVADLDGRRSLTPGEAFELQRLKKEKLHTKDALFDARD